ncbi:MAG: 50S ribosomal protein L30 [Acidimicrobiia bacterium]|nr:50S ribosomal protein L30 [Acidimicrobiia bacterium]
MTMLRVTQVRSSIGSKPRHRGTLRALRLGRIGRSHTLPDRPEIRGMVASVNHLVTVEEVEGEAPAPAATAAADTAAPAPAPSGPGDDARARMAAAVQSELAATKAALGNAEEES